MMKYRILIGLIVLSVFLFACNSEENSRKFIYFETNGAEEIEPMLYTSWGTHNPIAIPEKEGHLFLGWYLDKEFKELFTSFDMVKPNKTTLYAKWTNDYTVNRAIFYIDYFVIEVLEGDFDDSFESQVPVPVEKDDMFFYGWFKDKNYHAKYDSVEYTFSENIKHFYGKYRHINDMITISFETNGGTQISEISMLSYDQLDLPANPIKDGYAFDGWFIDSSLTKPLDKTTITNNMTLYAKWTESNYFIELFTSNFEPSQGRISYNTFMSENNEIYATKSQSLSYRDNIALYTRLYSVDQKDINDPIAPNMNKEEYMKIIDNGDSVDKYISTSFGAYYIESHMYPNEDDIIQDYYEMKHIVYKLIPEGLATMWFNHTSVYESNWYSLKDEFFEEAKNVFSFDIDEIKHFYFGIYPQNNYIELEFVTNGISYTHLVDFHFFDDLELDFLDTPINEIFYSDENFDYYLSHRGLFVGNYKGTEEHVTIPFYNYVENMQIVGVLSQTFSHNPHIKSIVFPNINFFESYTIDSLPNLERIYIRTLMYLSVPNIFGDLSPHVEIYMGKPHYDFYNTYNIELFEAYVDQMIPVLTYQITFDSNGGTWVSGIQVYEEYSDFFSWPVQPSYEMESHYVEFYSVRSCPDSLDLLFVAIWKKVS